MTRKPIIILLGAVSFFAGAALAFAFTGPGTCTAPNCSGAVASDASNNAAVGTSTTQAAVKFLVVASSTGSSDYAIKVLDSGQGNILLVRNDGKVAVATSGFSYTLNVGGNIYANGNITCSGSCGGGSTGAANVTPGVFNNGTVGVYSFPSDVGIGTSTTSNMPAGFNAYQTSTFYGNAIVNYATASRCLRLDSSQNIVAASGDCASGDTDTNSGGTVTTSTAVTASYFPFWNSTNGKGLNGTSSIYQSGLSVGIGTANPTQKLEVAGNVSSTGLIVNGRATTTNLTITSLTSQNCLGTDSAGVVQAGTCTGGSGSGTVTTSSAVTASYFPFWNSTNGSGLNGTSSIYQSGLKIGIGTLYPSSTLHIVGDLMVSGTNGQATTTALSITRLAGTGGCLSVNSTGYVVTSTCSGGSVSAANITPGVFNNGTAGAYAFPSDLGIGTTTTSNLPAGFTAYQTSTFLGRIGIGTQSPAASIDLSGTSGLTAFRIMHAAAGDTSFATGVSGDNFLRFSFLANGELKWSAGSTSNDIELFRNAAGSLGVQGLNGVSSTQGFVVLTSTSGGGASGGSPILDVDTLNSRVGVGTAYPSSSLHVAGDLFVTGTSTFTAHVIATGTTPTVAGDGNPSGGGQTCGTWSTIKGTDFAGQINTASATVANGACRITFTTKFSNPPICIATVASSSLGSLNIRTQATTTAAASFTFSGATNANGATFNYICVGL